MKTGRTRAKRVCYTYRATADALRETRTFCRFAGWQKDIDNIWHAHFAGKRKRLSVPAHLLTEKTMVQIGGQPDV